MYGFIILTIWGGIGMYDIAIIGAGIIGTSIAREISKYTLKAVLIEKENDVANGTTKANTSIIHAGYDPIPSTLKAKFNALGNRQFDELCNDLAVPFKRIGSLVVATNSEEILSLQELYDRGIQNGILGLKIIDREKALEIEPSLSNAVIAALYAPTTGIVAPMELAIALAENAVDNGVEILLDSQVTNVKKLDIGYRILMGEKSLEAKYVINAAGLFADEINNMASANTFNILPNRGQYLLLDKDVGNYVNSVVFQCPTKQGKGVVVLPTIHGNLLVGPTAEIVEDKSSLETTGQALDHLRKSIEKTFDNVPFDHVITSFAGLRSKVVSEDFIIEESKEAAGFINVAGIDSPGLTAAPAIAQYVVEILEKIVGKLEKNINFHPKRDIPKSYMKLTNEEKAELIAKDPRYGRIICRCENITEGEIVSIIKTKVGARTVDAVKRRARAGSGRCQGGFCSPRVMEIIARELNIPITEVLKGSKGSYILTEATKEKSI